MSMDTGVELLWFIMAFVLVLSAVAAHKIPMGTMAKMAVAWAAIIGAVFLAIWGWQLVR